MITDTPLIVVRLRINWAGILEQILDKELNYLLIGIIKTKHIIKHCLTKSFCAVDVTKQAEDEWVDHIISVSRFNEEFQASCTPGYYNNEGQPNPKSVQNGPYGKGSIPYFRITKAWRDEGSLKGVDLI